MLRRLLCFLVAFGALAGPGYGKDELIIGISQAPGTMNPSNSSTMAQSLIQNMTGRPFTAYDSTWNLVCLVCTELPSLEAGTARVIDLPDGKKGMEIDFEMKPMRWGDNVPVTTKDVAFTIEVGKHPLSGVSSAEGYRRILKLVVKDDRRFTLTIDRVTFHYKNIGLRLLPAHIERPIFEANPAEYRNKTAFDTDPTNPGLSYGPYRVVELVPNNRVVLERNPAWAGQTPYFRRLVVRIIESTPALQANLRAGSIDYAAGELGLSIDQALALEKRRDDKYEFVYKPSLTYEHIDMNLDNGLLKDRRIRQALLKAIDRPAISEKLFEGKQPVAHSCISPLDPMFSPVAPQYRHDPAEARALLAEAGFSDVRDGVRSNAQGERLSFELATTAGNRMREQIAQVMHVDPVRRRHAPALAREDRTQLDEAVRPQAREHQAALDFQPAMPLRDQRGLVGLAVQLHVGPQQLRGRGGRFGNDFGSRAAAQLVHHRLHEAALQALLLQGAHVLVGLQPELRGLRIVPPQSGVAAARRGAAAVRRARQRRSRHH